jgi:preprotein translocase subunit YajC
MTQTLFTAFLIGLSAAPAWAAPAPAAGGGFLNFVPILAVVAIMYFLLIRPQQKKAKEQQAIIDALKRGDRILTHSGIYATVVAVKGKVLEVKLNEDVKVLMSKSAVAQVVATDPALEPETAVLVNHSQS